MADTCATFTFGALTVNPDPDTDGLQTTDEGDIQGLDGAPITGQIDPAGAGAGASGSIVQNKVLRGRVVVFTGFVHIGTMDDPFTDLAQYRAKVNAVEAAAHAALVAQLNTPTNLGWTPQGGSAKTLSCTYGIEGGELRFSGPMLNRAYEFTLVSESATIS